MAKLRKLLPMVVGVVIVTLLFVGSLSTEVSAQTTQVDVCAGGAKCNAFITKYINPVVTLLTVVLGVVAAISIVIAAIQYSSAGDDPGKVEKAKERIWQTLIGVVAYFLLAAFINFLVPGGLF